MEKGKKLFTGTMLVGISAAFGKLISLCFLPLFTSALSPAELGVTEIFISISVLLAPLFSFYAPQATFRFLAKGERGAIRSGALLLGVGALLLGCLIPLFGRFETLRPYRLLLYFYVCASLARSFLSHILRARGRFGVFALQQGFCTLLTVLLQVLLLRLKLPSVTGYLLGILLGDAITFAILLCCFFPYLEKGESFSVSLFGKMLRYAIPLMPTALLWWGMGAIEKYFLLYYHGEGAMGLYAVAGRFPALIGFAAGVFLEVWHYAALQGDEGEGALFGRIYALFLPLMISAGVAVSLVSPILITRALASEYAEAVHAVGMLCAGAVCAGLASFLDSIYSLRLCTISSMLSVLGSAVVNLILSLLLIPRLGMVGAAVAGALSFAFLFFFRLLDTARLLGFARHAKRSAAALLLLFLSGALMAGGYYALAVIAALISLLPVLELLWNALLFFLEQAMAFLSYIGKNRDLTAQTKKDRHRDR